MDVAISNLKKRFPSFPVNILIKIYRARWDRLNMLMTKGIPEDVRWLIEAKVRLGDEISDLNFSFLSGLGKSCYAKKRRAKRLQVCYKCAKWTCNQRCRSIGFASINREDKI